MLFHLRNYTDHVKHIEEIEQDPLQSTEYGVNNRSILMDLHYLAIYDSTCMPDVMHDLFEGVLQYETKLFLIHCIGSHLFTLDMFNSRMEALELCYGMDSDRPTPNDRKTLHSDSNLLKQKGCVNLIVYIRCTHVCLYCSCPNAGLRTLFTSASG